MCEPFFGGVSGKGPPGVVPALLPSGAKRRSVDRSGGSPPHREMVQQRGGERAEGGQHRGDTNNNSNGDNNGTTTEEDESRSGDSGVGSKRGEEEEDGVAEGEVEGRGGVQGAAEDGEAPCAGCRDHHKHHRATDVVLATRGEEGEEEEGGGVPWHWCPLCRRPPEEPRVLPACLHVFCSGCLRRLLLPQLCAVPDEEGVEEMEMTAEDAPTPLLPATPLPATPPAEGTLAEEGATGDEGGVVPRGPPSESGRSESLSSRGPPSLRSWASFKGAWSPRSSRRRAADDDHPKNRDTSPRRLGLQRSLTVARTPPTSPTPARRAHGGSLRAPAPVLPLWRKRGSTISNGVGEVPADALLQLRCPACGAETAVPAPPRRCGAALSPQAASAAAHAAVATLPLLPHRAHGRPKAPPRAKCDLCSLDATSKCAECSLSLCVLCSETHRRGRGTAGHALAPQGGAARAPGRAPPCPLHPGNAQRLFCSPCGRLACRACPCAAAHRCEPVAHAARTWAAPAIRAALDKARPYADNALAAVDALRRVEQRVQVRASEVEAEVDCFVDSWVRALEEHRRALKAEAWRARDSKLEALRGRRGALERQAEGVSTAVRFGDDLLAEASDAEVLSVAAATVRRLEWGRAEAAARAPGVPDREACPVSLQFLPAELAATLHGHQMYGVVTAQAVCPAKCRVSEGLSNCRQHRKTEAMVVTRDADDQPIGHGGEQVAADLRYRDASHRVAHLQCMREQFELTQECSTVAPSAPVTETRKPPVHVEERCQVATRAAAMATLAIQGGATGPAAEIYLRALSADGPTESSHIPSDFEESQSFLTREDLTAEQLVTWYSMAICQRTEVVLSEMPPVPREMDSQWTKSCGDAGRNVSSEGIFPFCESVRAV